MSAPSRRIQREARRWQLQAENDLAYTRAGLRAGFAAQTCFMAQQVTEKALKAAMLAASGKAHRGHSCARLGVKLGTAVQGLEGMRADLMLLDQYYVPTRYPNGIPSGAPFEAYSLTQAEQALTIAARVCELVRAVLDHTIPGWEDSEC
jgi:HEPN domain-containing protein